MYIDVHFIRRMENLLMLGESLRQILNFFLNSGDEMFSRKHRL
jgi:hypothetical protein